MLQNQSKSLKLSQIYLYVSVAILILFSLGSSIGLIISQDDQVSLSGIKGVNKLLLGLAIFISFFSVIAVVLSFLKISWFLHLYEIVCLIVFILIMIILFGIAMMKADSENCDKPSSYFELKMKEMSQDADILHCSSPCPCPIFQNIQKCPTWEGPSYQILMQEMQQKFSCSGWCNIKSKYVFSDNTNPINGACYPQWGSWVESKWSGVVSCTVTLLIILLFNIMVINWRILQIWENKE